MDEENILSYQDYAEFAVIKKDINYIMKGIQAIERNIELLDYTDIIRNLSLLYHSAKLLNIDADAYFNDFASITKNEEFQIQITEFINRSSNAKSLEAIGYIAKNSPRFHYDYLNC